MIKLPTAITRTAAVAILVSGVAFAIPLHAAPEDTSEPQENTMGQSPQTQGSAYQTQPNQGYHRTSMNAHDSQAMKQHVEDRIKTLHAKLDITKEQEQKWNDVAQAMRDNEAAITQLIQERHQDPENMSAVDDLQSYKKIAQAHVDGLQKLIPAFEALYNDMSPAQKKDADATFSHFEGHGGNKKHG